MFAHIPSSEDSVSSDSFFRLLEMDCADTSGHPDSFDKMRRGDFQGILVHKVYSADILDQVVDRLERHEPPFLKTWFPAVFRSWFYGQNLNLALPDLGEYFRQATEFREHLRVLFPPGQGLTDRVGAILATLDNGRPFRAPPGPGPGEQYMFTTIRAHLEGGFIPPHCDNEHTLRPAYRHLLSLVEPHLMSFVLSLQAPREGGVHEVFDYRMEKSAGSLMNDDHAVKPSVLGLAKKTIPLPAGSMLIVDSGRYLHQVTPIVGSRSAGRPAASWPEAGKAMRCIAGDKHGFQGAGLFRLAH